MFHVLNQANILKNKFVPFNFSRSLPMQNTSSQSSSKIFSMIRPIIFSAFFLFCCTTALQYAIALYIPKFNILASKGLGKILFTSLIFIHIGLFLIMQTKKFRQKWLDTNILFLKNFKWLKLFFLFFTLFFCLHWLVFGISYFLGFTHFQTLEMLTITSKTFLSIGFGFIATFFLAWTEEVIFRGTFYPYFRQFFGELFSILITSFLFMIVHDITNPLNLLTTQWKLGLGLFLLGVMLNTIFAKTGKLYAGMGAHAGIVFVKVILRRIPFIVYIAPSQLPWWICQDLRQALLVHFLFALISIGLFFCLKKSKTQ
jgi:membrane protease YdiL (CAAX protease family)